MPSATTMIPAHAIVRQKPDARNRFMVTQPGEHFYWEPDFCWN